MAQRIDLHPSHALTWQTSAFAHLTAGHRRLGGQIEARSGLRLFAHPIFDWTFFNTARQYDVIPEWEIDPLIRHVIDFYERRHLRPAWDVSDRLAPPTLGHRLMQAGFCLDRCENLMALPLQEAEGRPEKYALRMTQHAALTISPIHHHTLDYFIHAWRQGFAIGPDTSIGQVRALFSRDLEAGWDFWCAWQGERPVGTLASLTLDDVVQVANVSTLPALRRQGIASRLMRHALDQAIERDARLMYLHATAGSPAERLYRHLGFQVLDQWRTFVYDKSAAKG